MKKLKDYWDFVCIKLGLVPDDWVYLYNHYYYTYYTDLKQNEYYLGYVRYSLRRDKLEIYADKKSHQFYSKILFPAYVFYKNLLYNKTTEEKINLINSIIKKEAESFKEQLKTLENE